MQFKCDKTHPIILLAGVYMLICHSVSTQGCASVYRECLRHERTSSSQLLPISLQLLSLCQLLIILNQLVDLIRDTSWSATCESPMEIWIILRCIHTRWVCGFSGSCHPPLAKDQKRESLILVNTTIFCHSKQHFSFKSDSSPRNKHHLHPMLFKTHKGTDTQINIPLNIFPRVIQKNNMTWIFLFWSEQSLKMWRRILQNKVYRWSLLHQWHICPHEHKKRRDPPTDLSAIPTSLEVQRQKPQAK